MTIASGLLQRHFETLVDDNAQWQTLIADELVWELPYAPALDHPTRLTGREEVMRHMHLPGGRGQFPLLRSQGACLRRPGSRGRRSQGGGAHQAYWTYVVFRRAAGGKIAFLREYFNPVRASQAMDAPILGLEA